MISENQALSIVFAKLAEHNLVMDFESGYTIKIESTQHNRQNPLEDGGEDIFLISFVRLIDLSDKFGKFKIGSAKYSFLVFKEDGEFEFGYGRKNFKQ